MERANQIEKASEYILKTIHADGLEADVSEVSEDEFIITTGNLGKIKVEVAFQDEVPVIQSYTVTSIGEQEKELKFTDKSHFARWLITYDQLYAKKG
jgi:hypothetical protein